MMEKTEEKKNTVLEVQSVRIAVGMQFVNKAAKAAKEKPNGK